MTADSHDSSPDPFSRPGTRFDDEVVPNPVRRAAPRVLASAVGMVRLVAARRLHTPRHNVGRTLHFADGTSARVYRETTIGDGRADEPTLLVVSFVLRGVRGWGHAAFRLESWLNTPMFVGFPGFTSKLWCAHDVDGRYRGVYEWDGADRAQAYVQSLGWVLGLVSVPGTVRARIVPGLRRDDAIARPELLPDGADGWWRPG